MQLGRYGLRDVMDTQIFRLDNATPLVFWPYANSTNLEMNSEAVYATGGKGAPRRISFFGSKTGTITFSTQIFSMDILGILIGSDVITNTASDIFEASNAKVQGSSVTLPKTPLASPAPIAYKFVNGVKTTPVPIVSITGKEVSLDPMLVSDGDEVQVFYQWTTTSSTYSIAIAADKFPPYVKIVGDAFFVDEITGEEVDGQFVFYKARAMPNFTLSMSNTGDPTTLDITFDLFAFEQEDGSQPMLDITLYDDVE